MDGADLAKIGNAPVNGPQADRTENAPDRFGDSRAAGEAGAAVPIEERLSRPQHPIPRDWEPAQQCQFGGTVGDLVRSLARYRLEDYWSGDAAFADGEGSVGFNLWE
jgi:hypothetical protein